MTKEKVASIVKYCNDNGVSYKARLSELGVPEWKFFESKRRHAKEQASSASPAGVNRNHECTENGKVSAQKTVTSVHKNQ